ncbi:MAG: aspartate racemase [Candidatus Handelsmanbacteria bacterium RIFCSPLOWO2_12_FULL_64_10]|uniref:Aspartate racemase n=1 Tax=Handelsmanbacteria sp. (strain RIFCSPLOWO2_12_FULL_64_10) TaxID=1817868 RepID=A0A1F6CLE8_HANXR|nr:MAG: aspartate racemase [Candidatus Handelsmanbacteria bacterium RIFCSPLOWO2_12_FULL_64_10]
MSRHIGIIACSAEGAALCYRTIAGEAHDLMGKHRHPEVTMHTHSLDDYMTFIRAGDWGGVANLMVSSAKKAAQAGADLLICPDNTIHIAYDEAKSRVPQEWLHIAEVVATEAARRGFKKLGVLGTKYTMDGPVYADKLGAHGIEAVMPDPLERTRINLIIFDELVMARFSDEARDHFVRAIDALAARGCDAVVLGCTEIPLLIDEADSPLPTLDSTRLLARAALHRAAGP